MIGIQQATAWAYNLLNIESFDIPQPTKLQIQTPEMAVGCALLELVQMRGGIGTGDVLLIIHAVFTHYTLHEHHVERLLSTIHL